MNETSTTARSTGVRQDAGPQGASVGPLHRYDPRVVPQGLRQLAATDVHGVDLDRVALEQQVREAARRRAHVQADEARPAPIRRRPSQPEASARHERRRAAEPPPPGRSSSRRGRPACDRSATAGPSPTRTWPPRIRAWARVRLSVRPRSTRSWSRRWRVGLAAGGLMPSIVAHPAQLVLRAIVGWPDPRQSERAPDRGPAGSEAPFLPAGTARIRASDSRICSAMPAASSRSSRRS